MGILFRKDIYSTMCRALKKDKDRKEDKCLAWLLFVGKNVFTVIPCSANCSAPQNRSDDLSSVFMLLLWCGVYNGASDIGESTT